MKLQRYIPSSGITPSTRRAVLLPAAGSGSDAQVVGRGALELRNAFGAGRLMNLELDRRPGQTSRFEAAVSDPFLAGSPIRADVRFNGLQQDSTFTDRAWSASAAYRFGTALDALELGASFAREATRPGEAGARISDGRQRVAREDASFWGVEVRLSRLDDAIAPHAGLSMSSRLERGTSTVRRRTVAAGDTIRTALSDNRERLSASVRGYIPVAARLSTVVGVDARLITGDDLDESDLYRFGGASTLRGYDEDRFRAATALRMLVELRSWFEERSFGYVFLDVGYVSRPKLATTSAITAPAVTAWHPGFGLGAQFETGLGIMNVSYAMNDDDGLSNGRVHVGLRFGL